VFEEVTLRRAHSCTPAQIGRHEGSGRRPDAHSFSYPPDGFNRQFSDYGGIGS
jgi:hypothetical protein